MLAAGSLMRFSGEANMKTTAEKRRGPTVALVIVILMGLVMSAYAQADHPIVAAAWSPDGYTIAYVNVDPDKR